MSVDELGGHFLVFKVPEELNILFFLPRNRWLWQRLALLTPPPIILNDYVVLLTRIEIELRRLGALPNSRKFIIRRVAFKVLF